MNERIRELLAQAGVQQVERFDAIDGSNQLHKFAELIVKEHLDLLRQEWYKLNNLPNVVNESPRDSGLRLGKKSEIIVLIEKIKKHFGVKE